MSVCLCVQSHLTLCDPIDCSQPDSSVYGILKARILEWVAIPFPGALPNPGMQLCASWIGRRILYHWAIWEAQVLYIPYHLFKKKSLKVVVTQSCPTLCISMACSQPVSSVCGILQAGILEGVAVLFSRGFFRQRDWTCVSCNAGRFFTVWASREALHSWLSSPPTIWTNRLSGSLMK